jgi:hypothetical protein
MALSSEYSAYQEYHAAMMGQRVPGMGRQESPFALACIQRALEVLEKYFPEDAALIRAGKASRTQPDSPNGWQKTQMGDLITIVERTVARMRNPHPGDTTEQINVASWFDCLLVVDLENKIRTNWGFAPVPNSIQSTKDWMRTLPGCPEVAP